MLMLLARAFFLATDAKQKVRLDPTAVGANNRGSRINLAELRLEGLDLRWLDEIDLVQKQNVRALDLQACGVTELWETDEHIGVDYRNDAVEPALRQRLLNVKHERFGFSEAGSLDDDHLGSDFLNDLVDRCFKFAEQRAANTSTAEFGDPHIFSFDDFCVDGDRPEFIHHDGDLCGASGQNVT